MLSRQNLKIIEDKIADQVNPLMALQDKILHVIGMVASLLVVVVGLIVGYQIYSGHALYNRARNAVDALELIETVITIDQKIVGKTFKVQSVLNNLLLLEKSESSESQKNNLVTKKAKDIIELVAHIRKDVSDKRRFIKKLVETPNLNPQFKELLCGSLEQTLELLQGQNTTALYIFLKSNFKSHSWKNNIPLCFKFFSNNAEDEIRIDEEQLHMAIQVYRMIGTSFHLYASDIKKSDETKAKEVFALAKHFYQKILSLIEKNTPVEKTEIKEFPNRNGDLMNLAEIHAIMGEYADAYDNIKRAVKFDTPKQLPSPLTNEAIAEIPKGEYDQYIIGTGYAFFYQYLTFYVSTDEAKINYQSINDNLEKFIVTLNEFKKYRNKVPGFYPGPIEDLKKRVPLKTKHDLFHEMANIFISLG